LSVSVIAQYASALPTAGQSVCDPQLRPGATQALAVQTSPAAQAWPQVPQFAVSVATVAQAVPQSICDAGQCVTLPSTGVTKASFGGPESPLITVTGAVQPAKDTARASAAVASDPSSQTNVPFVISNTSARYVVRGRRARDRKKPSARKIGEAHDERPDDERPDDERPAEPSFRSAHAGRPRSESVPQQQ